MATTKNNHYVVNALHFRTVVDLKVGAATAWEKGSRLILTYADIDCIHNAAAADIGCHLNVAQSDIVHGYSYITAVHSRLYTVCMCRVAELFFSSSRDNNIGRGD